MTEALGMREAVHRLRRPMVVSPVSSVELSVAGRNMINFCSNDYLGLSKHPLLAKRAGEYMIRYGAGGTASRLVCANFDYFERIEGRIAKWKKTGAALILASGYQANATMIPALAGKDDLILSDSLNHNSIIQGTRLSKAVVRIFAHNDPESARRILAENRSSHRRAWVISESVFSMDGDIGDLDELKSIAEEYDAILLVDDAHATGVMGDEGSGLAVPGKNCHIAMGTFSKGAGVFGAYVAGLPVVKEYLINFCPGLIYSTALPPQVAGAIDAALELIPQMDKERSRLSGLAQKLRSDLSLLGFDTGRSVSQIIPVIVGSDRDTLALSSHLFSRGILAVAIRPPTVPENSARIRISLSAAHEDEHIERLLEAFESFARLG